MVISSKANPEIKRISSLAEKKFRNQYGEFIVESVKAVDECLSAGMSVSEIVCTASLADRYVNPLVVTNELFARISTEKSPQGVLAVVKKPDTSVRAPNGSCILLDRLQDPGNLGTVIRTANAAGYDDIYLINCTDAFSPKAVRASMGGIFYVNIHEGGYDGVFSALDVVPLVCADMDGEDIFAFKPPEKFCLCIGNEGGGVSDILKERCRFTVKIPMRSTCESLNAAVSAAVAMYVLKN